MASTRRATIYTRNTMLLVLLWYLLDTVIGASLAQNENGEAYSFQNQPNNPKKRTWTISDEDNTVQVYADLKNILNKLNVITVKENSSFLTLQTIVREITDDDPSDESRTIGVYLCFKEVPFQNEIPILSAQDNTPSNIQLTGCSTSSGFPLVPGLNSLAMKKDTSKENSTSSAKNGTGIVPATQSAGDQYKKDKGLSRTQVVVIATCSAVIGTFFIIAGAMRISSCVKRYRANREQALNLARRASCMGLNGSNLSSGILRRDSSSSKASRQSNTTFKGGSDLRVNRHDKAPPFLSHNSPPLHNTEHKPLLPVNSVTQSSEGGSSHGSLAYIDEESQSKAAKDNNIPSNNIPSNNIPSGNDNDSEDDPLLRKSPSSGSSIDVTMADVYTVENESVRSYREIFEPGGQKLSVDEGGENEDEMNGFCESPTDPENVCDLSPADEIIDSNIRCDDVSDVDMSSDNGLNAHFPSLGNSFESIGTDYNGTGSDSNLDACMDVNDSSENNIADTFAVTIGFNQSDSSLSDNPSYAYGNQTEYCYNGGYGYIAYTYPYANNYTYNYKLYGGGDHYSGEVVPGLLNSDGLFLPGKNISTTSNSSNQNHNISPGDMSSESRTNSNENVSEPLLPDTSNHRDLHYRTPSGNIIFYTSGADNSALTDFGDDVTGRTLSTVVSHIVPLAVYHNRSASVDEIEMR